MLAFGPIPSRRLGRSLGINNIPPKICSYSCVYCQVGDTIKMQAERQDFYEPEIILKDVQEKVEKCKVRGEQIDYLTFAPDGEPTLDINLGREIDLLKPLGIKIAVLTNASLIGREDVRKDLIKADWVSLKVDAGSEETWREINKPAKSLKFATVLTGMLEFRKIYSGTLATETMLIAGINDSEGEIKKIAIFLEKLKPDKVYIAIPTRPPARKEIKPASEDIVNMAYQLFNQKLKNVECLLGYEGNAFAFTGNVEEDLLSITSVHPMREEGVKELLKKARSDWGVVEKLIRENKIKELQYQGKKFYARKLQSIWRERCEPRRKIT